MVFKKAGTSQDSGVPVKDLRKGYQDDQALYKISTWHPPYPGSKTSPGLWVCAENSRTLCWKHPTCQGRSLLLTGH